MTIYSFSVMKAPMASNARAAASNLPTLFANPCSIPAHVEPCIDAGSDGTLDVPAGVIEENLILANMNADRRQTRQISCRVANRVGCAGHPRPSKTVRARSCL